MCLSNYVRQQAKSPRRPEPREVEHLNARRNALHQKFSLTQRGDRAALSEAPKGAEEGSAALLTERLYVIRLY
jgi:hypothetical protein